MGGLTIQKERFSRMADKIITQKCNECKAIKQFSISERIADLIALEILQGTNEKAMDVLGACGFKGLIAGTFYAPLSEVVKFYGVSTQYIKGLFTRYGFSRVRTPEDVLNLSVSGFLKMQNVQDRYLVSRTEQDAWRLSDRYEDCLYIFPVSHEKTECFCSARLILAISAIMYYGRRIPKDSVGFNTFERLRETSYNAAAVIRKRQNESEKREALKKKEISSDSLDLVPIKSGGELTLPVDKFIKLVVVAAQTLNTKNATQEK